MLQIEPTTRCNYSCEMCAHRVMKPPVRDLIPSNFERLLREISVERIHLQGLGEPFLCPNIRELAKIARKNGVVTTTTNGSVPFSKFLPLFDEIVVSLHSLDPEKYRLITGGNLQTVLNNLEEAWKQKTTTELVLQCVVTHRNVNEIEQIEKFSERYDGVIIVDVEDWLQNTPEFKQLLKDSRKIRQPSKRKRCKWGLTCAYVTCTGELTPCCIRFKSFGNVFEYPFDTVWNSAEFRKEILKRSLCKNCPGY